MMAEPDCDKRANERAGKQAEHVLWRARFQGFCERGSHDQRRLDIDERGKKRRKGRFRSTKIAQADEPCCENDETGYLGPTRQRVDPFDRSSRSDHAYRWNVRPASEPPVVGGSQVEQV